MEKSRYIVLTDINSRHLPWTEKDDIQSLIRLLLYSNEIDLEGIILCSSCFLKKGGGLPAIKLVHRILDAYAAVKSNLDCHASGYPNAEKLRQILCLGIPAFGHRFGNGFGEKQWQDNPGVLQIIRAVDNPDPRPVWIGLWGGANTLAQAIWQVSQTRSEEKVTAFLSKLRIHSISDQDNSGKWLREHYGSRLFYIVTPTTGTVSGSKEYYRAVWPGISGEKNNHGSEDGTHGGGFFGAEAELVSRKWLKRNIQKKGPLGKKYPRTVFLMEGDTPAFLGLIPNGLNVPEHPEYGGWAGRYMITSSPEGSPIYSGAADAVVGTDGKWHISPQASLWRWRPDFQHDFAARMAWTVSARFNQCCHPPIVRLDQQDIQQVKPRQTVTLDASASESPDGATLAFHWFWYLEAGSGQNLPKLSGEVGASVDVTFSKVGVYHLILQVKSVGQTPLCRYRRIIFNCVKLEVTNEH